MFLFKSSDQDLPVEPTTPPTEPVETPEPPVTTEGDPTAPTNPAV